MIGVVDDLAVIQDVQNLGRIALDAQPADAEFLTNPLDLDGNTLETSDDLVALLGESNTQVTETKSAMLDGIEARVYEIVGRLPQSVLKRNPEDERGWFAPQRGQIWLLEHPERGLLMINAEAWDD